ncbi:MAG: adenylate/guanylate cyclase domain-containing protein [Nannocystis sp.]|uniref:adenylate/guanylate cyclase domain-containing protein n=1 Tax=Nannocystis sp. TaxID=1962667 RepID=UPI002429B636|nr:adenylate/guanylate cyclase domain-containing protein [Nannocystis sp.]MBK9755442.1 adenylate/guanylate cyclase domain-containing protein [Nannocystis sp.]
MAEADDEHEDAGAPEAQVTQVAEDPWQRLWDDPDAAAAELQADPQALAAFVRAMAELSREHAELTMLHEATLEHANEIEDLLAVKIDEVEALVVNLELRNGFIREVFGRYITDDVVNTLLASPAGLQLGGEKRKITILISDVRGFSSLCERLSPEQVVTILNIYLGAMAEVIERYRGSINEFIGDAILAVFGAPIAGEDHPERAVACALAMQLAMDAVNDTLREQGLPGLEMGIGVHTGEVVVGNIGSQKRAKYGVVGSHVNLTSRIESYTVGGQVLISQSSASEIGDRLRTRRSFQVLPKGAREALTIYDVVGICNVGGEDLALPDRAASKRTLAAGVPVRFTVLEGKDASGEPLPGTLLSLDDRGDAEIAAAYVPDLLANVKLSLDGLDEEHAYAKVQSGSPDHGIFSVRLAAVPPALAAALSALPWRTGA